MLILPTPYENTMHDNQTLYKRTVAIGPPPPAYSVWYFENYDN